MEIPVTLSTSFRGNVNITLREGLSTLFRSVNIIISTYSDSLLFENVDWSVYFGERCSIAPVYAVRQKSCRVTMSMVKTSPNSLLTKTTLLSSGERLGRQPNVLSRSIFAGRFSKGSPSMLHTLSIRFWAKSRVGNKNSIRKAFARVFCCFII